MSYHLSENLERYLSLGKTIFWKFIDIVRSIWVSIEEFLKFILWKFVDIIKSIWVHIELFLNPILKNLDPSLFQSVILGILAVFIPFAIVFLMDILDSKKQRSEFEKMVLSEQVLSVGKVFWVSVIGLVVLAFFSGENVSDANKLFTFVFSVFLIFSLWIPFKRVLRFSEGYKKDFEISFLKSLQLLKVLRFVNGRKMEKMHRAWGSLWTERLKKQSIHSEKEITRIFIQHIDNLIDHEQWYRVISLIDIYIEHLDQRSIFPVGYDIFPKLFEWNRKFLELQKTLQKRSNIKERLEKPISEKYFPTFKKYILSVLEKFSIKTNLFYSGNYFRSVLFPEVVKILLHDRSLSHQLFKVFKNFTDKIEEKLEKCENEVEKDKLQKDLESWFSKFCPIFFENIYKSPSKDDIWEIYFPKKWKITLENSKEKIPRIILSYFFKWIQYRNVLKLEDSKDVDEALSEVIKGIFPNYHTETFLSFLMLLFSDEIKNAIQKRPNFSIIKVDVVSSPGEKSWEEISHLIELKAEEKKKETIDLIFTYFKNWRPFKVYKSDLSEEQLKNWEGYSEHKQNEMLNQIRQIKLEKILSKLNSTDIINFCKKSEYRKVQREYFIELITLILKSSHKHFS